MTQLFNQWKTVKFTLKQVRRIFTKIIISVSKIASEKIKFPT